MYSVVFRNFYRLLVNFVTNTRRNFHQPKITVFCAIVQGNYSAHLKQNIFAVNVDGFFICSHHDKIFRLNVIQPIFTCCKCKLTLVNPAEIISSLHEEKFFIQTSPQYGNGFTRIKRSTLKVVKIVPRPLFRQKSNVYPFHSHGV